MSPPNAAEMEDAFDQLEPEFDLRAAIGVLRRHLRLIVLTVVVCVAAAGLALVAVRPVYTASTLVLVDPAHKNLLDPSQQAVNSSSDNARVDSEVELVKSESTLLRVIRDLGLVDDPELGVRLGLLDSALAWLHLSEPTLPTGDGALQMAIGNLRDAVTVQRRGLTYLISIQAASREPAKAALVANTLAADYIKGQLEAKIQSTLASRDIIQSRIAEASAAVAQSEQAFDDFIVQNLDSISAETGRTDLLELRRQLAAIDAKRSDAMSIAQRAETSLATRDWQALAQTLKSDALAKLEANREALARGLAGLAGDSQRAIDLRAELARLETQLDSAAALELTSMRKDIAASQAQASDLRTQLRSGVLGANLPAEVLTRIYGLQQNAEIARTQYQALLARLHDLDAQAYLQVADSRVVSEALPPNLPSFPNPPLILGLAALLALGLGTGLAFLVENYVGGFTSEAQAESVLGIKVVASVPRERPVKTQQGGEGLTIAEHVTLSPLSLFAEAVRRIRIGLDQVMRGDNGKPEGAGTIVMVSSAAPEEGKTTIALSLARAYALSGRSTLLIDCDLRKPSVHHQLGIEPSSGLLDYLTHRKGEAPGIASFMVMDEVSGAQVVVGSRRSDVPTDELISRRTFSRLIEVARQNFDIVILDTPPLGPVVDGLYLAPLADAILFVIRWTSTSQQDVQRELAALEQAKRPEARIVGVLNQQEGAREGYARKYAGYYGAA